MALVDTIRSSFERSIGLYQELTAELREDALDAKLPGLRSNRIGQQLWCVVGARESYSRALAADDWSGFSCSLGAGDIKVRSAVLEALDRSASAVREALVEAVSFSDNQNQLALDLLEHEAAHQGQLIRYLYALELPIPAGWKARYALD